MNSEKTNQPTADPATEQAKTSPRGMAPDKAHGGLKTTGSEPDVEVEETFNNSPNNSGAVGSRPLK